MSALPGRRSLANRDVVGTEQTLIGNAEKGRHRLRLSGTNNEAVPSER